MNLYLVSQDFNSDFDTYDSFVVVAENEETAKTTPPEEHSKEYTWCDSEHVTVELIGVAIEKYTKTTVILASFNGG